MECSERDGYRDRSSFSLDWHWRVCNRPSLAASQSGILLDNMGLIAIGHCVTMIADKQKGAQRQTFALACNAISTSCNCQESGCWLGHKLPPGLAQWVDFIEMSMEVEAINFQFSVQISGKSTIFLKTVQPDSNVGAATSRVNTFTSAVSMCHAGSPADEEVTQTQLPAGCS